MKRVAFVIVAACSDDASSLPDAGVDAPPADSSNVGLVISSVAPAGGHTLALDERGQYAVTINNIGPTTGAISAVITGSTDFTLVTNGCSTLGSGGYCEIELRLIPSVIGPIDAQLVVTASPGGSATANLHGTGLQRNTLQLADRIDFRGQAVGQTSTPRAVIVTNNGTVATGPLTVTVAAGKFSLQGDSCTGQSIASLGTCVFSLVYAPTTTPPLGTGDDTADVLVSGTPGGVGFTRAAGYGATILMDEWQYLFADTAVGATSAAKTLTLTNTQSFTIGPLTSNLQFLGAPFLMQQDNCNGVTLAAQATCTYVVAFRPTAAGLVAGSIQVSAPDVGTLRAAAGVAVGGTGL